MISKFNYKNINNKRDERKLCWVNSCEPTLEYDVLPNAAAYLRNRPQKSTANTQVSDRGALDTCLDHLFTHLL